VKGKGASIATVDQQLKYATTIINAMSRGPATPCARAGYHLWASTIAAERQTAARLCRDCPILQACGQQADRNRETSGIWGRQGPKSMINFSRCSS
jgi:hypothetical protein